MFIKVIQELIKVNLGLILLLKNHDSHRKALERWRLLFFSLTLCTEVPQGSSLLHLLFYLLSLSVLIHSLDFKYLFSVCGSKSTSPDTPLLWVSVPQTQLSNHLHKLDLPKIRLLQSGKGTNIYPFILESPFSCLPSPLISNPSANLISPYLHNIPYNSPLLSNSIITFLAQVIITSCLAYSAGLLTDLPASFSCLSIIEHLHWTLKKLKPIMSFSKSRPFYNSDQ